MGSGHDLLFPLLGLDRKELVVPVAMLVAVDRRLPPGPGVRSPLGIEEVRQRGCYIGLIISGQKNLVEPDYMFTLLALVKVLLENCRNP